MASTKEERERELGYIDQYQKTGDKKSFLKLYRNMGGLINLAMSKSAKYSTLPQAAFQLEAAQWFKNSLDNFDPNRGVQFKTYAYKNIEEKLKRINYKYQNIGRISERSGDSLGVYHVNQFKNAKETLSQQLNREPSAVEIANVLKVTPDKVEMFEKELRRNITLNAEIEDLATWDEFAADKDILSMHYYDMTPEQQLVYDYASGEHGKTKVAKSTGVVDWKALSRRVNMPEAKVQKVRKQIVKILERQ